MIIKEIKINNYKNIENISLSFDQSCNIIVGDNKQGKTNLLESIYLLSTTKTINNITDEEMIKEGSSLANIEIVFKDKVENNIKFIINKDGKNIYYNHNHCNSYMDIIGKINTILFNYKDIFFFDTTPKNRRKYIDLEIGKFDKTHLNNLKYNNKLIKDRNNLLKEANNNYLLYDILDDKLVNYQFDIVKKRNKFIDNINKIIISLYNLINNNIEKNINIEYHSELLNFSKEKIKKLHRDNFSKDIATKTTNLTINKDDYVFKLGKEKVSNYCSQGEKRKIIITFKLAIIEYIKKELNINPIFLIDDFFSELDLKNIQKIIDNIPKNIQTIITTTEINNILNLGKYKKINIKKGNVIGENYG